MGDQLPVNTNGSTNNQWDKDTPLIEVSLFLIIDYKLNINTLLLRRNELIINFRFSDDKSKGHPKVDKSTF